MKYDVYITDRAAGQMRDAANWWSENRSTQQAGCWYDGLVDALDLLCESPDRFPLARENDAFPFPLREMLYGIGRNKTHRVLFAVRPDRVVVYAIRHAAQQDLTIDEI